jgi:hypothetical protein
MVMAACDIREADPRKTLNSGDNHKPIPQLAVGHYPVGVNVYTIKEITSSVVHFHGW